MFLTLEKLFEKFSTSEKDRYEMRQIFELLPEKKKKNILANFEVLSLRIQKIQRDLQLEQEILIWSAIERIREAIAKAKK